VVTVNDHDAVAPATQRQVLAERSPGVLVGGRRDRGFDPAVLTAFFMAAALLALPSGCVFDDGPKVGPGLEPPNTTVGAPGRGQSMTPVLPAAGTSGAFGNPGGAPGMAPGPETPGAGSGGMGMAAAGTGAAPPPAGEPTGAAGLGVGTAGMSGTAGAASGSGGAGGPNSDPDAGTCEAERVPALGVDQRIIAPPDGGGRPIANACEYTLPDSATPYLPDHVNLEHTREGQRRSVPRVAGPEDCDLLQGGFYYDDPQNPTRIIACPSTCARIVQGGVVEIVLGCPTVLR
jgi:hypothetical protein